MRMRNVRSRFPLAGAVGPVCMQNTNLLHFELDGNFRVVTALRGTARWDGDRRTTESLAQACQAQYNRRTGYTFPDNESCRSILRLLFGRMASLAMASSLAISMSLARANNANPAGSSASYTTLMSTSIPARLRVSGAPRSLFTVTHVSPQGTQSTNLEETVQHAIDEAEEVCAADEASGNCAAAWDEVEELAAAVAHKKVFDKQKNDPLEAFCKEVPEADECKVYED